jgi:hypothetical protein
MVRRLVLAAAIAVGVGVPLAPANAGGPILAKADLKIANQRSGPFFRNDYYAPPSDEAEQRVKKTAMPGDERKYYLKLQHDEPGAGTRVFEIHADDDAKPGVQSKVRGYRGWNVDPAKELSGKGGVPLVVDENESLKLLLAVKIKGASAAGRVDWLIRAVQPMGPTLDTVVARTQVI